MTYDIKLGTEQDIENILNNAIVLGPLQASSVLVGGKTVIFNAPVSQTVTFPGSAGDHVSVAALVTALSAVSGLHVKLYRLDAQSKGLNGGTAYAIALFTEAGLTIDKDGTANALLGIPTAADTEREAPVASSRILHLTPSATLGAYALLLEGE